MNKLVKSFTCSLYNVGVTSAVRRGITNSTFISAFQQQQQPCVRSFFSQSMVNRSNTTTTQSSAQQQPGTTTTTTSNTSSLIQSVLKGQKEKEESNKPVIKTATATLRNLPYSQWKLMPLFKAITGLSYREAIAQLTFANIGPANQIKGLVTSARYNAEYYKNLDPDRLIVSQIYTGRSHYQSRIEFKGRGRTGIRRKPFTHVTVELKEVEKVSGEKKLGKFGKTHKTIENYNNPLVS
ncbi:ribosomal protein L22 [Heterostelium album PN500]|uniref:Ribosomal protein L22 n=1 Tax=Heterostelium pallidum (strain ATCC 26659 / Pp 5 / PN500) TaxID=670386 RepID=D3B4V6_HETP5|nr:ribosomal protein L22 [Heterostelium album PN500]EFA84354.1 ribosomal protein L22 [Heterostelium album PN500]|eukprot:XP_020436469.1 ribosomal protein L22 [Heterostelium album PN500]